MADGLHESSCFLCCKTKFGAFTKTNLGTRCNPNSSPKIPFALENNRTNKRRTKKKGKEGMEREGKGNDRLKSSTDW